MPPCWYLQLYSFRNGIGLKKNITNWKRGKYCLFFSITNFCLNVFLNNAIQICQSYLISMSKLKSFEFSSKWRQERIFYLMRLVSMLQQTENLHILQWILKFMITCVHPHAISKRIKLGQPATSHLKDLSQSFKMVTDFLQFFSI